MGGALKIWRIAAKTSGYDVYDSAVVIAKSEEAARRMHPGGWDDDPGWARGEPPKSWSYGPVGCWVDSWKKVEAIEIGDAKAGETPRVVVASFNAG